MEDGPETQPVSVIIVRPDDVEMVAQLVAKRQQYADRLSKFGFTDPEQAVVAGMKNENTSPLYNWLKHWALSVVLDEGVLVVRDFVDEAAGHSMFQMSETHRLHARIWAADACLVIGAYCVGDLDLNLVVDSTVPPEKY